MPLVSNLWTEDGQAVSSVCPEIGAKGAVRVVLGSAGNGRLVFLSAFGTAPPDLSRRAAEYGVRLIGIFRTPFLRNFGIFHS